MNEKTDQNTGDSYQVTTRQQVSDSSCELIAHAGRTIDILVYDYDEVLLPHVVITDLLTQFFLQHRHNQFRYLCSESDLLRERGRGLIELARKFSSFIKLRQLPDGLKPVNRQYLLVDEVASMSTRDHGSSDYFINTNDRARGRQLKNQFEELWQRSDSIPGIHVTGLSG